jgi:hypothetical protein
MDVQIATPAPAYVANSLAVKPPSVAATKVSPLQQFICANRGRRNNTTVAAGTTTVSVVHVGN